MSKSDGGPAFPGGDGKFACGPYYETGMSLRDWFAGMALQGLISRNVNGIEVNGRRVKLEEAAYMVADAMLKERSK